MQIRTRLFLTALWMTVFALRPSFAQQDSTPSLRISLLTCSPGDELYSTFGHTAIRVTDSANDLVFNYGTFDFSDPDFYTKFVRGRLEYFLSIEYFSEFYRSYQFENRAIYEQELNLNEHEKTQLFHALLRNAQQENKFYKYDFLLNNCTTKGRDRIIEANINATTFSNFLAPATPNFRDLLHEYLTRPDQQWIKLGIDLLMGQEADQTLTIQTAMFLPDYLMKGVEHGTANGQPIAKQTIQLLNNHPTKANKALTPQVFFGILAFIIITFSFIQKKNIQHILRVFDYAFFLTLGLLGTTLLLLWIATDHHAFSKNWNILWALPTHLIFINLGRNRLITRKYYRITFFINVALLLLFFILPQAYNYATIPLLLIIATRSYILQKKRS